MDPDRAELLKKMVGEPFADSPYHCDGDGVRTRVANAVGRLSYSILRAELWGYGLAMWAREGFEDMGLYDTDNRVYVRELSDRASQTREPADVAIYLEKKSTWHAERAELLGERVLALLKDRPPFAKWRASRAEHQMAKQLRLAAEATIKRITLPLG